MQIYRILQATLPFVSHDLVPAHGSETASASWLLLTMIPRNCQQLPVVATPICACETCLWHE